jgi:hypothetical protein
MAHTDKSTVIAAVCRALASETPEQAESLLRRDYPFAPPAVSERRFHPVKYTRVFVRDGFTDRYTGDRLVFPPVLRVLSFALPNCFPYHSNWKTDLTHPAYWELSATLDHVVPVTRGGLDEESNWVTTSMVRNAAKMNWTLAELGWQLLPPGDVQKWDGMLHWFLEYTAKHPEAIVDDAVQRWHQAAKLVVPAG